MKKKRNTYIYLPKRTITPVRAFAKRNRITFGLAVDRILSEYFNAEALAAISKATQTTQNDERDKETTGESGKRTA